jgi:hypothetical protein
VKDTAFATRRRRGACRKHASRRATNAPPFTPPVQRALVLVSAGIRTAEGRTRVGLSIFLSVDPVAGGSANDYDYANQDPINKEDLAGSSEKLDCTTDPSLSFDVCVQIFYDSITGINGRTYDRIDGYRVWSQWSTNGDQAPMNPGSDVSIVGGRITMGVFAGEWNGPFWNKQSTPSWNGQGSVSPTAAWEGRWLDTGGRNFACINASITLRHGDDTWNSGSASVCLGTQPTL